MAVILALGPTLDRRVAGDRIRSGIALVAGRLLVAEFAVDYLDLRLFHRNDDKRDADRCTIDLAGAKIGMKILVRADARNVLPRTRVDRQLIDRRIPDVVRGKDRTAC